MKQTCQVTRITWKIGSSYHRHQASESHPDLKGARSIHDWRPVSPLIRHLPRSLPVWSFLFQVVAVSQSTGSASDTSRLGSGALLVKVGGRLKVSVRTLTQYPQDLEGGIS